MTPRDGRRGARRTGGDGALPSDRRCVEWDVNPTDDIPAAYSTGIDAETPGIQHGTQMAGVLGAEGNHGRNVSDVMQAVRVLEARADGRIQDGASNQLPFDALFAGVDYLASQGAHDDVCASKIDELVLGVETSWICTSRSNATTTPTTPRRRRSAASSRRAPGSSRASR